MQHDGYDWFELAIPACPQGELKPSALLVYNFELSIAQLALVGGTGPPSDAAGRWSAAENLEEVADFLVSEAPRACAQVRETQTQRWRRLRMSKPRSRFSAAVTSSC